MEMLILNVVSEWFEKLRGWGGAQKRQPGNYF